MFYLHLRSQCKNKSQISSKRTSKMYEIKSGWSIVYILKVSYVINLKKNLALKVIFALANSANTNEMPHNVVCQKNPFRSLRSTKS